MIKCPQGKFDIDKKRAIYNRVVFFKTHCIQ